MKVLISGVMMATLAATCANAAITVEQRKAACEKSADKVWVSATETCVPKDVCADNKLAKSYCEDLYLTSYNVIPYGASITPKEVLDIYVKQKGLKCSIAEGEIFTSSDGSKNVPCKGDDYFVFRFGADDTGGNVTDVFCGMFDETVKRKVNHGGYPTICSGLSEQSCNKIKDLIGNKAPVEFTDNNCTIGEYAPDATKGYIFY